MKKNKELSAEERDNLGTIDWKIVLADAVLAIPTIVAISGSPIPFEQKVNINLLFGIAHIGILALGIVFAFYNDVKAQHIRATNPL